MFAAPVESRPTTPDVPPTPHPGTPAVPDAPGETSLVAVVGAGYVGLVTAACLASQGRDVAIVDTDPRIIGALQRGEAPIPEPHLPDLLRRHRHRIRHLGTSLAEAIPEAAAVLLSVGTPEGTDGLPDLTDLERAVRETAPLLGRNATLVVRSTVLPGTTERMSELAAEAAGWPVPVGVVPEFLAEGRAVEDFLSPDRIVIGADDARTEQTLRSLFGWRRAPVFTMDTRSAEAAKYAANAMLAVRISFATEVADFAVAHGAAAGLVLDAVGARPADRSAAPEAGRRLRRLVPAEGHPRPDRRREAERVAGAAGRGRGPGSTRSGADGRTARCRLASVPAPGSRSGASASRRGWPTPATRSAWT